MVMVIGPWECGVKLAARRSWPAPVGLTHGPEKRAVLVAATRHGGALMGQGEALGQIRPGILADLQLVDGNPLADLAILQDQDRLLEILKDGAFHKPPPAPALQASAGASLG